MFLGYCGAGFYEEYSQDSNTKKDLALDGLAADRAEHQKQLFESIDTLHQLLVEQNEVLDLQGIEIDVSFKSSLNRLNDSSSQILDMSREMLDDIERQKLRAKCNENELRSAIDGISALPTELVETNDALNRAQLAVSNGSMTLASTLEVLSTNERDLSMTLHAARQRVEQLSKLHQMAHENELSKLRYQNQQLLTRNAHLTTMLKNVMQELSVVTQEIKEHRIDNERMKEERLQKKEADYSSSLSSIFSIFPS